MLFICLIVLKKLNIQNTTRKRNKNMNDCSYRMEPTKDSIEACKENLVMHAINKDAKTNLFFQKHKIDPFNGFVKAFSKKVVRSALTSLKKEHPNGKIVIFTKYVSFSKCFNFADVLAIRHSIGFYFLSNGDGIVAVVHPITGEVKQCAIDLSVKDHGFEEFGK